jgi:hypothetical protein
MAAPIPFLAILANLRRTLLTLKETRRALQVEQEISSSIPILPTDHIVGKALSAKNYPEGENRALSIPILPADHIAGKALFSKAPIRRGRIGALW